MSEYINIGKIVAAFGLTGELIVKHSLGKRTLFKTIDAMFIEVLKGSYLPYFIVSAKSKDHQESFIQFEGVDTREKAQRLIQKQVWLTQNDFRKLAAKKSSIALLGYKLFNERKELGEIQEVIEQQHQVLVKIFMEGKEVLIPLHKETLEKVDHKKAEVYVQLPEGLLDVYLKA